MGKKILFTQREPLFRKGFYLSGYGFYFVLDGFGFFAVGVDLGVG